MFSMQAIAAYRLRGRIAPIEDIQQSASQELAQDTNRAQRLAGSQEKS